MRGNIELSLHRSKINKLESNVLKRSFYEYLGKYRCFHTDGLNNNIYLQREYLRKEYFKNSFFKKNYLQEVYLNKNFFVFYNSKRNKLIFGKLISNVFIRKFHTSLDRFYVEKDNNGKDKDEKIKETKQNQEEIEPPEKEDYAAKLQKLFKTEYARDEKIPEWIDKEKSKNGLNKKNKNKIWTEEDIGGDIMHYQMSSDEQLHKIYNNIEIDTFAAREDFKAVGFTEEQAEILLYSIIHEVERRVEATKAALAPKFELENDKSTLLAHCADLQHKVDLMRSREIDDSHTSVFGLRERLNVVTQELNGAMEELKLAIKLDTLNHKNANTADNLSIMARIHGMNDKINKRVKVNLNPAAEDIRWIAAYRGAMFLALTLLGLLLVVMRPHSQRIAAKKERQARIEEERNNRMTLLAMALAPVLENILYHYDPNAIQASSSPDHRVSLYPGKKELDELRNFKSDDK